MIPVGGKEGDGVGGGYIMSPIRINLHVSGDAIFVSGFPEIHALVTKESHMDR